MEIISGVFEGKTTGTSIGLLIRNTDQKSKDYGNIAQTFRPGHADYTYTQKYGFRDYRGGGRSSARETAMRVAAGAIAKKFLFEKFGIEIRGHVTQIGTEKPRNWTGMKFQIIRSSVVILMPFHVLRHWSRRCVNKVQVVVQNWKLLLPKFQWVGVSQYSIVWMPILPMP